MRVFFGCILFMLLILGMASGQDTNFATGPQYLVNSDPTNQGSPLFLRPISTPSLSLTGPPLEIGAINATGNLVAGAEDHTMSPQSATPVDLFSRTPRASSVEISFSEYPAGFSLSQVPASILDTGVWQTTTAQALRERGYGVTLPEAAAYSKARIGRATHVYTNSDIGRLRGGG